MKKNVLSVVVLMLLAVSGIAQTKENVARECVLFELFTGVRCPYCPAAANGVAQLMEEGKAIAPVAYHTSAFSTAEYFTSETNARASYYGVTSYPTLITDGLSTHSGGGTATQSNYSTYLNYYNQRINETSPFTIEMSYEPISGGQCIVHCTVTQVGECTGNDVRVMIALTQCNINVSWQGMSGLHHVVRDMIPSQTGTPFTGPTMTIDEAFYMDYPREDCFLTAWVQNFSTPKEVYQAVRMPMTLEFDYDLTLKSVEHMHAANCSGIVNPEVSVKSYGNEPVNSFDLVVSADGNEVYRMPWTGTLHKNESVMLALPEINIGDSQSLTFDVLNPNGHQDDNDADNSYTVNFEEIITIDGYLKLQLRTDTNPEETTVDIVNMDNGEVVEHFTFDQPNHVYQYDINLNEDGCYRINVKDSGGDGFITGFFGFKDSHNNTILQGGNSTNPLKYEMQFEINCDNSLSLGEIQNVPMELYPNPSEGTFYLSLGEGTWNVEVYDITGRVVYQDAKFTKGEISLNKCESGIYFLKANNGLEEKTRKILVY